MDQKTLNPIVQSQLLRTKLLTEFGRDIKAI